MKRRIIPIITVCVFLLTGCSKMNVSDKQSDLLAEYMAGTVLKYTDGYNESLIYQADALYESSDSNTSKDKNDTNSTSAIQDKENTNSGQAMNMVSDNEKDNTQSSQTNLDYVSFIDNLGYKNFNIDYSGYEFYKKYPSDNSYYSLETTASNKLLVVSFDITNLSDKTETLDLTKSNIGYQLETDGTVYAPMITLLMDDMQYLNLDFAAGELKKAVIVFNVLKDVDISNMNLIIFYQNKTTTIEIN